MRKIKYDFTDMEDIFDSALGKTKMSSTDTMRLRKEINKFFSDSECTQVYFTDNSDKMFFGIIVSASINENRIYDYLMGVDDSNDLRISRYSLEYDSHLFNPTLGLTAKELVAITLHEIGHVVNDLTPIENARKYLDEYMAKTGNRVSLATSESTDYKQVLAYALKDFISKDRSMFYTSDVDEILADDFARAYGYGPYLESAMEKILAKNAKLYSGSPDVDKFAVFLWTLELYKNMGTRRIPALRTLRRAKGLTGSRIEKMQMDALVRNIERIDDSVLIEGASDNSLVLKIKSRMRKMRINTMKSLDDDYYEINMRIRNVEDEDDALYLMRQLNTRISLITDFIESEDLSSGERKEWQESLDRFKRLRADLSNTMVYKSKNYGIFVSYPDLVEDRY